MNEIVNKLDVLDNAIKDVLSYAESSKGEFTYATCPLALRGDHYHYSQLLAGLGKFEWNCVFCGWQFSE